ncbi:MAG: hypothetical protein UT32_C0042G0005 [Parcubacteria group bacterium GW2011_GWC2_39_14]|nr:MAG: hypothetical protein UT32_C0042G0005 [Parcubacteria group bacterium GW2011_GWC2_39_14]
MFMRLSKLGTTTWEFLQAVKVGWKIRAFNPDNSVKWEETIEEILINDYLQGIVFNTDSKLRPPIFFNRELWLVARLPSGAWVLVKTTPVVGFFDGDPMELHFEFTQR